MASECAHLDFLRFNTMHVTNSTWASECSLVYPQMDSQELPNNWADTLLLLYSAEKQSWTITTTTITQQVLVG